MSFCENPEISLLNTRPDTDQDGTRASRVAFGEPGSSGVVEDPVPLQKTLVLVGQNVAVVVDFGSSNPPIANSS